MNKLSRRKVTKLLAAGAITVASGVPYIARAAKPKVVVVGGGAGGATAARYIAMDSNRQIDVTLLEPSKHYYTCFFSNLYLGGLREYASLGHTYERLARVPGLNVVHEWAVAIDRERRMVKLSSGTEIGYDRLVLSPGIDLVYDAIPGYSVHVAGAMPHAWKSGTQLQHLRHIVESLRPGGTFVVVPPPAPARCPPGPYERVSMLAHVFKQRNPTAKIVILDPKEKYPKQVLFEAGWQEHYPDMILWLPASISGGLIEIDAAGLTFKTELEDFRADAASVVPPQRAASIARDAGLTDATGWCPIVPSTMQSTFDEKIHVIGDAAVASAMPKSAYAANSQAKVVASAVRQALTGAERQDSQFANICWSLIAPGDGVKVGASYTAGDSRIEVSNKFVSQLDESADVRELATREASAWYTAVTRDMFA